MDYACQQCMDGIGGSLTQKPHAREAYKTLMRCSQRTVPKNAHCASMSLHEIKQKIAGLQTSKAQYNVMQTQKRVDERHEHMGRRDDSDKDASEAKSMDDEETGDGHTGTDARGPGYKTHSQKRDANRFNSQIKAADMLNTAEGRQQLYQPCAIPIMQTIPYEVKPTVVTAFIDTIKDLQRARDTDRALCQLFFPIIKISRKTGLQ
jgi:hypothetical protein